MMLADLLAFCSVDGVPLPIDELRGIKMKESIDLSGKKLGVASGTIIASCIAANKYVKSLKWVIDLKAPDTHRLIWNL